MSNRSLVLAALLAGTAACAAELPYNEVADAKAEVRQAIAQAGLLALATWIGCGSFGGTTNRWRNCMATRPYERSGGLLDDLHPPVITGVDTARDTGEFKHSEDAQNFETWGGGQDMKEAQL